MSELFDASDSKPTYIRIVTNASPMTVVLELCCMAAVWLGLGKIMIWLKTTIIYKA